MPLLPWPRARYPDEPPTFAHFSSEEARREQYELATGTRGGRLCALVSDFMCSECQSSFLALEPEDVDRMAAGTVREWCERMQLCCAGGQLSAEEWQERLRERLRLELRRVQAREELARAALEHQEASSFTQDFEAFVSLAHAYVELLAARSVSDGLPQAQLEALDPEVFCVDVSPGGVESQRRPFGIASRSSDGLWWSSAVPHVERPMRWCHYTGRPGYVSPEIWCCRAWVSLLGGFARVSAAAQQRLLALEGIQDVFYSSLVSDSPGGLSFVHVVDLCPGGVPTIEQWLAMCSVGGAQPPDCRDCRPLCRSEVLALRARILEERERVGLTWTNSQWEVSAQAAVEYFRTRGERPADPGSAGLPGKAVVVDRLRKWQLELEVDRWPAMIAASSGPEWRHEPRRREHYLARDLAEFAGQLATKWVRSWHQRPISAWLALLADSGFAGRCSEASCPADLPEPAAFRALDGDAEAFVGAAVLELAEDSDDAPGDTSGAGLEYGGAGLDGGGRSPVRSADGGASSSPPPSVSAARSRSPVRVRAPVADTADASPEIPPSVDPTSSALLSASGPVSPFEEAWRLGMSVSRDQVWEAVAIVQASAGKEFATQRVKWFLAELCSQLGVAPSELQGALSEIQCYLYLSGQFRAGDALVVDVEADEVAPPSVHGKALMAAVSRVCQLSESLNLKQARAALAVDVHVDPAVVEAQADIVNWLFQQEMQRREEARWRPWLHARSLDACRCSAYIWDPQSRRAVFGQCANRARAGSVFCGLHKAKQKRRCGCHHPRFGLLEVPAKVLARGIHEARRRGLASGPGVEPELRFADVAQSERLQVPEPQAQPEFVEHVPGELRAFEQDPTALPPYVCRLCPAGFASRDAFEQHINAEHASPVEYRKRLFYLESSFLGVRPVLPQVWRHCTEAFTEHLVTGHEAWPACAVSPGSASDGAGLGFEARDGGAEQVARPCASADASGARLGTYAEVDSL